MAVESTEKEPETLTPESVRALLGAGAPTSGVAYPSGYAEVDELIRAARG